MKCLFNFVLGCLVVIIAWAVVEATSSLKQAKANLRQAEHHRDLAQIRLRNVLAESCEEEMSDPFFVIAVNLGEDLDDLQACMEFAWIVCENEGEVVCGMDITGG